MSSDTPTSGSVRPKAGSGLDPRLRRAQARHAFAILVLPAIGSLIAIGLAVHDGGVPAAALMILLVSYMATYAGITVGLHRLFAHRAFETTPWLRAVFAVLGCMAAQGPAIYWAANHRVHHIRSDRDGDPHSPRIANGRQLGRWEPELTRSLAAAVADEDELGGSGRSRWASSPAPRAGAAQDAPRGGTRHADMMRRPSMKRDESTKITISLKLII